MKISTLLAAGLACVVAAPASAAVVFSSTFENVPGGPGPGTFVILPAADGWTGSPNIELQNNVAGAPAPNGGAVFVELDTFSNSAMTRAIGAGTYLLDFLYSPRPGVAQGSNGIEVLLNGTALGSIAQQGVGSTVWSQIFYGPFTATAGSTLTFRAIGTSDGLGGYVDNITLATAVPEPTAWALLILGFGVVGGALRRNGPRRVALRFA